MARCLRCNAGAEWIEGRVPDEPQDEADTVMPKIVCLCGSTRFADEFARQNLRLTLEGKIVLSIGANVSDASLAIGQDSETKRRLDELHLRKIDLADEVLVLNVGGYIGESTRREIAYAEMTDTPVRYLEEARRAT